MNTKKIFFGICTCLVLMAAACTTDTADSDVYEDSVNKKFIGDQSSVNKKLIGDQSSVNKKHVGNQSSSR